MTFLNELEAEEETSGVLVGKPDVVDAAAGTKLTGYIVNKKAMPEKCSNCEHYLGKPPDFDSFGLCIQEDVLKDDEVPTDKKTGKKNVDGERGWCREWEKPVDGTSQHLPLLAAAELPDIVGFNKDVTQEIRDYLIKFPRKLLHHTQRVEADPELGAVHGRYIAETKTVQINPKNFTNGLKFGTHNPADIDEHVLAHELCHGLFESLSEDEQKQWYGLSGWMKGTKKGQALPYVEQRPGWPHAVSSWTHSTTASFARKYQEKSPAEDFADSAAYYCTGNGDDLPKEKREFIEQCL